MVTYTLFLFSIMHYMLYLITGTLLNPLFSSMVCILGPRYYLCYTAALMPLDRDVVLLAAAVNRDYSKQL